MNLTKTNLLIIALILLALGYGIGRYLQPADVVTEVHEVVKEVEVIKKDVVTVIKENPDGSKETTITDRTTIEKELNKQRDEITKISTLKPQWRFQGIVGIKDFKFDQSSYGLGIERRILGPISAGAFYKTKDNEFGLTASYEL